MSIDATAIFRKVPEGWTGWAEEIPGTNVQEATLAEAHKSLREAVALILEVNRELALGRTFDDVNPELQEALEDRLGTAAYFATRGEELFPSNVVERLCAGESPVRVFREHRGLAAAELARRAGVSPSYLSEIENGRKPGSARALRDIAVVLKVDTDELVK